MTKQEEKKLISEYVILSINNTDLENMKLDITPRMLVIQSELKLSHAQIINKAKQMKLK